MKTRYYKLKLFLVPFNAFMGTIAVASARYINPFTALAILGLMHAGTAMYALVNEVPRRDEDDPAEAPAQDPAPTTDPKLSIVHTEAA